MLKQMRWYTRLTTPAHGEERWREIIETVKDRLGEDESGIYLAFPELDGEEDPRKADEYISEYITHLNRAIRFVVGEDETLERGRLIAIEPNGTKRSFVLLGLATVEVTAFPARIESGDREQRIQLRQSFFNLILSDKLVCDLIELSEHELTTTNMYNIIEGIIKYDLGDREYNEGFAKAETIGIGTKKELKNLKRCLQHRQTAGVVARHYFVPEEAPEEKLTLREMRDLTTRTLQRWVYHKLELFRQSAA